MLSTHAPGSLSRCPAGFFLKCDQGVWGMYGGLEYFNKVPHGQWQQESLTLRVYFFYTGWFRRNSSLTVKTGRQVTFLGET
jgi:hypothetical protein